MIKETIDEDTYSKFNESAKSSDDMQVSKNYEKGLGIEEANDSVKEIDYEWYTFVTNDKTSDSESETMAEPKEIDGIKTREREANITSKHSDLTSKARAFQCTTCLKLFTAKQSLNRPR